MMKMCSTQSRRNAENKKSTDNLFFSSFEYYSKKTLRLCVSALAIAFLFISIKAQSTNQNFPTAVTTNEISGAIKARDLGDARLTSYFYVFNGAQGDVFINVVANNFNGNIDVFTADGLKPLTKIVVFADAANNETGRVVYLRKPERLLLRVEGRTPNDDAATYRIKFAGSFRALNEAENTDGPAEPKVASASDSDVRVNSVGTIISVKPRPTPQPKETVAENGEAETKKSEIAESKKADVAEVVSQISVETDTEKSVIAEANPENIDARNIEVAESKNKIEVIVTENAASSEEKQAENIDNENSAENKMNAAKTTAKTETIKPVTTKRTGRTNRNSTAAPPKIAPKKTRAEQAAELSAALENVRLVVLMKDGEKIEKPMSEVLRFSVDKGILTIIARDGTISRYSILNVAKMTIE